MYTSSRAIWSLCLSCLGFLMVGVEFISNCSIFFNLFLVSGKGGVNFSFALEVDLYLLSYCLCCIFWGRICCFLFCWVVFGIYFLLIPFWSFMMSVLTWVVVSSESSIVISTGSISIQLNLLDNGIGSFISVCLVWIFSFLRGFFLILVVSHVRLKLLKCVP